MKFRCERDVLAEALAAASRAARAGSLPVLAGVHLQLTGDRLRVTGTDLELTIRVERTVSGERDGVAVVPARLASDIVRAVEPGAVHLTLENEEMQIAAGRSQFTVRTLPVEDYPRIADPAGAAVVLPAADLTDALRQVVRAASSDEARPILTGVLLTAEGDGLRLVATDSYRLALRDLPGTRALEADQKVLVPSKALAELVRLLGGASEVSVHLGERDVAFEAGDVMLSTRLIEGEFPNYRQLIPSSYPNRLTIGREPLLDAIRRVKLLARESTPLRLSMSANGLDLTAVTQDVGQASETIDAKYEGTELTVAFNPEYLSSGVEAVGGDEVTLESVDALKPAVVKSVEHGNYLYLLMPVRVS
ncbi:MAG: DNA polymerase III subunit beta [Acidimicrobiia bacterium]